MGNYRLVITGKVRPTDIRKERIFRHLVAYPTDGINVGYEIVRHIGDCWARYGEFDILDIHYSSEELKGNHA